MSERTLVVVLFFWALLTIVTPTLVRWAASAKPQLDFLPHGEKMEEIDTGSRILEMMPRRALVQKFAPVESVASEPAPAPAAGEAESLLGSRKSSKILYIKTDYTPSTGNSNVLLQDG